MQQFNKLNQLLIMKKNSGYKFVAFNKAFYSKNTSISVTASQIASCLDYKYYWVATNEDPETFQYTTGIKSGITKTSGCAIFAIRMLNHFIALILLLFVILLA